MLNGRDLTLTCQMGNCVSNQSRELPKRQQFGTKPKDNPKSYKAVMEKYPAPTKYRGSTSSSDVPDTPKSNLDEIVYRRSKLRPPSISIRRPSSINCEKNIDSNGNIPRPSSLPRYKPGIDVSFQSKLSLSSTEWRSVTKDPEKSQESSGERTVLLQQCSKPDTKTSVQTNVLDNSTSPSLSSMSGSTISNRSISLEDSGIASASISPTVVTVAARKSALSLKFGYKNQNEIVRIPNQRKSKTTNACQTAKSTPPSSGKNSSHSSDGSIAAVKSRAASVLSKIVSVPHSSLELKPKMSIEAIVASLEQEIRNQLGTDENTNSDVDPGTQIHSSSKGTVMVSTAGDSVQETHNKETCIVEHFAIYPSQAEVTYVVSPVVEFIENISPLQTPSSLCSTINSPKSPEGLKTKSSSLDPRSPADDEDSAATSISDALIDDEIADQPGLMMLNESSSVPESPTHSWRSGSQFQTIDYMHTMSITSEEDVDEGMDQPIRILRRRVASVSDVAVDDLSHRDLKETMRPDLFQNPAETVVLDVEEFTAMTHELADIKAKLVSLQTLLMDTPDRGRNNPTDGSSHLWDLKRDIVLLKEELQEKNHTIRVLQNELQTVGRVQNKTSCRSGATCNVATQTDKPRNAVLNNGLSPSREDVHLVSSNLKKFQSGLPVRTLASAVLSNP